MHQGLLPDYPRFVHIASIILGGSADPEATGSGSPDDIIADMVQHPVNPAIWGLRNLGQEDWSVERADGTMFVVAPGKSFQPSDGTKVHFGNRKGIIRQ